LFFQSRNDQQRQNRQTVLCTFSLSDGNLIQAEVNILQAQTQTFQQAQASVTGVYGYLFRTQSEGWARFCEVERLDPTVCEQAAPGAEVLNIATDEAEASGFTEAQTREHLKREGKADPDALLTAATVEAQVREGFRSLLARWE
jgi:hypothetical protein